ncbi:MAG: hypothetical protein H7X80_03325 [bacterium]|nr:hypothetical protein [Candidatus Kapabacteria bacterium]
MFERVITQTIQRISSEVLRDRQSVPLTEILDDDRIPTRFKPFFATEVRWWLYNDVLARGVNKRFDFSHPELSALLDYLEQVMFRHARFEHDEFVSTLDGAVKLTYNYLCRPQTTLKWYIFRGQPVKPLSEVMLRFESFLDYEYIGNVFAEWVERKVSERATFEAISATEFERIIRRIDDQILLSCTVDELLALLDPIFDFIGEGVEENVPLDALIIFFDDKNITRLVEHLDRYRTPNAMISRERFVEILDELLTSADENPEADFSSVYQNDELDDIVRHHLEAEDSVREAPPEPERREPERREPEHREPERREPERREPERREPEPIEPERREPEPTEPERREPEPTEPERRDPEPIEPERIEAASVDVDQAIGNDLAPQAIDRNDDVSATTPIEYVAVESHEIASAEIAAPVIARGSENVRSRPTEPVRSRAADTPRTHVASTPVVTEAAAETDGTAQVADIPTDLDPMLERKVLKKIFDRDRVAFDETMQKLSSAETWRHASTILDELFIRFDVDPYSRTAQRFTDIIYTRYLKKSHN